MLLYLINYGMQHFRGNQCYVAVYYDAINIERWSNEGVLELRTAFSRDQDCKIYVQDLILEDARHIWNLLQVIETDISRAHTRHAVVLYNHVALALQPQVPYVH